MLELNNKIIAKLFETLKEQTAGIALGHYFQYASTILEDEGNLPDDIGAKIIEAFPWPIGVEMRRFFSIIEQSEDEADKIRAEKAVELAEKAAQFFALVLLAQLWDEVKAGKAEITEEFSVIFAEFHKPTFGVWNGLIREVHKIFTKFNITPFTEHFTNPFFRLEKFESQLTRLVAIRNDIRHRDIVPDIAMLNDLLTNFLCSISFMVKYDLASVSKIEVHKSRLSTATFEHSFTKWNNDSSKVKSNSRNFDLFIETPSVMLFKDAKSPGQHLNLSPLIIDTSSVLKDTKVEGIMPGIYIYSGQQEDRYMYYFTDKRKASPLNSLPQFAEMLNEFTDLKKNLEYAKPVQVS